MPTEVSAKALEQKLSVLTLVCTLDMPTEVTLLCRHGPRVQKEQFPPFLVITSTVQATEVVKTKAKPTTVKQTKINNNNKKTFKRNHTLAILYIQNPVATLLS